MICDNKFSYLLYNINKDIICWRRDSNPQALRHTLLKRTCIPIPSPQHISIYLYKQDSPERITESLVVLSRQIAIIL